MCGIIGAFNKKQNVNDLVINIYQDQKNRGQEGFGLLMFNNKKEIDIKRATEPTKFMLDLYNNPCHNIIAHHRTPTSTDNKLAQTHPLVVSNKSLKYDYYVVHNGIIRNDDEMKEQHEKAGFKYLTETAGKWKDTIAFNDSEAIAIELARYIENQTKKVGCIGSFAFIVLQCEKTDKKAVNLFYGGNNINPLNVATHKTSLIISSQGPGEDPHEVAMFKVALNTKYFQPKKMKLEVAEEPPAPVYPIIHHNHLGGRQYPFGSIGFRDTDYDDIPPYNPKQIKCHSLDKITEKYQEKKKNWLSELSKEDQKEYKEQVKEVFDDTLSDLRDFRDSLMDLDKAETIEDTQSYGTLFASRLEELQNLTLEKLQEVEALKQSTIKEKNKQAIKI